MFPCHLYRQAVSPTFRRGFRHHRQTHLRKNFMNQNMLVRWLKKKKIESGAWEGVGTLLTPCSLHQVWPGGADAVGEAEGPARTISTCWGTASATRESFPDGNKNFISIGISMANNFMFILVTPSKLPKCVQELSQPVMRWHRLCDVLLSCKSWNSEEMK